MFRAQANQWGNKDSSDETILSVALGHIAGTSLDRAGI